MFDYLVPVKLAAGDLSLEFELWSGWARRISWRGVEVARAIYCASRDENWGTHKPVITHIEVSEGEGRFGAWWSALYPETGLHIRGSMSGSAAGQLEYRIEGEAAEEFLTMRTGLCLLHPHEHAGQPCSVTSPAGRQSNITLPLLVSPHQPAMAISQMLVGGTVSIAFSGEIFEMEDQRNWSDASFKTYCRPLALPKPYAVGPGSGPSQAIVISMLGDPPQPPAREPLAGRLQPPVNGEAWIAKHDARWWPGGFVDMNRAAPFDPPLTAACFGISPQVHAFDDRSILENVLPLPDLAASARALCPGPLCFGPIALSQRGQDQRLSGPLGLAWEAAVCLILGSCRVPYFFSHRSTLPDLLLPFIDQSVEWRQFGQAINVLEFFLSEGSRILINLTHSPQDHGGIRTEPLEVKVVPKP